MSKEWKVGDYVYVEGYHYPDGMVGKIVEEHSEEMTTVSDRQEGWYQSMGYYVLEDVGTGWKNSIAFDDADDHFLEHIESESRAVFREEVRDAKTRAKWDDELADWKRLSTSTVW